MLHKEPSWKDIRLEVRPTADALDLALFAIDTGVGGRLLVRTMRRADIAWGGHIIQLPAGLTPACAAAWLVQRLLEESA